MKVQVTSKPALRLMGERPIFENRWRRFTLELPIPSDYDTDNVTATFEGGRLSVTFAKLTKPKETTNPPEEEAPKPKEPSQRVDEQKGAQEDTPKAKEDKAEEARTNEVSDQKAPQKEEPIDETEKSKTETAASKDKGTEGARTNGSTETTEAAISKAPKTKNAKSVSRSKTRLIDFAPKPLFNWVENEALGDSATGLNKGKKLVKLVVLILLLVGLGLYYSRNAFRSSNGEWNFQEQELLFPY